MNFRKLLLLLLLIPLCSGCVLSKLDFGGNDQKSWEFKWGWERGTTNGTGPQGTVDSNGNYVAPPEVANAFSFPLVTAGFAGAIYPNPNITPTVGMEACEFKVPYVRWWEVQGIVGNQMVGMYLGKKLVSVFDISAGPFVARDFQTNKWEAGLMFSIIKF